MKNRNIKLLIFVLITVVALTGCSSTSPSEEPQEPERTFTLEELKEYDGKDGRDAYVAVDNVVYDVTNVGAWEDGIHNGNVAGKDLTEEIKEISPHGVSVLDNLAVVGVLEE